MHYLLRSVIARGQSLLSLSDNERRESSPFACRIFENTEYYMYIDMDIIVRSDLPLDFIMSNRKLRTLSGDERVKVQLAKLLMKEPYILLLELHSLR